MAQPHSPCVKRQQLVLIKQNLFRSICSVGKKHDSTFCSWLKDIKEEKQLLRKVPVSLFILHEKAVSGHLPQPSQAQSKPGR